MMMEPEQLEGSPVRSLQYMLARLSGVLPWLPEPEVDGVFGEETLEAVLLFQRELHPPVTGVVDGEVYSAIRTLWLEAEQLLEEARPLRVFPAERYSAHPGAAEPFLILPQTMFRVLSRIFTGLSPCPEEGCHTGPSVDNVRWLQRTCGLEEDGVLSPRVWNLLCRLYEAAVVWAPEQAPDRRFRGGWG